MAETAVLLKGGDPMNREKKAQIAYNTHRVLAFFILMLFLSMGISCFGEADMWMGIGFLACGLVPVFYLSTSPWCYIFTDDSVEIQYHFGLREVIRWDTIRSITASGSWIGGGGLPQYALAYPSKEKIPFFMNGEIVKNRKTKKLLAQYYHREIR